MERCINTTRDGRKLTAQTRREDIQGLRAVAVIAVVCFHSGLPLSGGFAGVDVFFVISGYVITSMLAREWDTHGRLNLTSFYWRRFKRLMPALALVVCVTAVLGFLFLSPLGSEVSVAAATGVGAIFTIANVAIATLVGGYFDPAAETNPLLNTWSLSVEEQFYLFFPVMMLLALTIGARAGFGRLLVVLAIAATASLSFLLAVRYAHKDVGLLGFYSPFARAWEFAAGSAVVFVRIESALGRFARAMMFGAASMLVLSLMFLTGKSYHPGIATIAPVLGTALLILVGGWEEARSGLVYRALTSKPLVYIGDVSYSWYLWHWPFIVFASLASDGSPLMIGLAVLSSLGVAAAAYNWFENPLRSMGPIKKGRASAFVGVVVGIPLTISSLLYVSNAHGYWSPRIQSYRGAVGSYHASNAADCGQGYVPTNLKGTKCRWNADGNGRPIYLVGDSNADHLSEAAIGAGAQLSRPTSIVTKGGCAFIGNSWSDTNEREQEKCRQFTAELMQRLLEADTGTIIIGLSDSLWYHIGQGGSVGPDSANLSSDPEVAYPYLQEELRRVMGSLMAKGHDVVLVLPVPKFVTEDARKVLFSPAKCVTLDVLLGRCPVRVVTSTAHQDAFQAIARREIEKASVATGSKLIDLRSHFCPGQSCSNYGAQGIQYRDAGHITVGASNSLTPVFVAALSQP